MYPATKRHLHLELLIRNAKVWAQEYLDLLGVCLRQTDVLWNERYRTTIATAELEHDFSGRIELSLKVYPALPPEDRLFVIAHEVSHLAAWTEHGFDVLPHGPEWMEMMRTLGFRPMVSLELCNKKGGLQWPRRQERRSG